MRYQNRTNRGLVISRGRDVEVPVLSFLYNCRKNDVFYVKDITQNVNINSYHVSDDSVRDALNRLWQKKYVEKFKKGKYTLWRITRNIYAYPEIKRRIGISIKPISIAYPKDKKSIQEDFIYKISKTTKELTTLKNTFQMIIPQYAGPIEVGYQILSNLDTIRNLYNCDDSASYELKNALNETLKDITKNVVNSAIQPIKQDTISNIVESSSKYLEEKQVFKDIIEVFKLDESYSDDFKDFYQTSLNNYLNQEFDEHLNPFR